MIVVVAVAVLAVMSIGLLAGVGGARVRAGAAADAAALAAAVVGQQGGDGCAAAARITAAHRAAVIRCALDPAGAVVTVAVPLQLGVGGSVHTWDVVARARAGPVPPP